MFDHLPDGTMIEDLFCDDPVLLEPLLTTTNILSDNVDSKSSPVQCKQIMLHKSQLPLRTPTVQVDNQLLQQLINDVATVDQPSVQVNSRK